MTQTPRGTTGPAQPLERRQRLQSERRKLVEYTGLSYAIYELGEGSYEVVHRAHTMDIATRRLVPHNLGSGEPACMHRGCNLMILNTLAADYAVDAGWTGDDLETVALQLVMGDGPSGAAEGDGDDGAWVEPDQTQPLDLPSTNGQSGKKEE